MSKVSIIDGTGASRHIGNTRGDTFVSTPRTFEEHLFRGGAESVERALAKGSACWALDLGVAESFPERGIMFVEISSDRGRYRTTTEMLLGPKSFTKQFGNYRPQVFLPLRYWTHVPTRNQTDE